jgi:hypothetical protein
MIGFRSLGGYVRLLHKVLRGVRDSLRLFPAGGILTLSGDSLGRGMSSPEKEITCGNESNRRRDERSTDIQTCRPSNCARQ